jgi:hypothetical protein
MVTEICLDLTLSNPTHQKLGALPDPGIEISRQRCTLEAAGTVIFFFFFPPIDDLTGKIASLNKLPRVFQLAWILLATRSS